MKPPQKFAAANLPTPLHSLTFEGNKFLIKRDDYTGLELSGNKVRKLDYLMYQAKRLKSDYIFTAGGDQSNHARATAIYAARLGIKSKLFLWGKDIAVPEGNLFIDKLVGARITYLDKKEFFNVNEIMADQCRQYQSEGSKVYVIPAGGSNILGIWGYINFMNELNSQIDLSRINGILAACGSGGTAAGLLTGASLLNVKTKIYAVNVLGSAEEMKRIIISLCEACIAEYKLPCTLRYEQLHILDGYSPEGYKNISDDKLEIIKNFARTTGIILDPAYTGKAFAAYYHNFLHKGKGMKTLFLHTGGLFGVFPKKEQYL